MNVSRPFITVSTTTRLIHASSFGTTSVGEEFDVHMKVQLPFEIVMDFCARHKRKKVVIGLNPILSKSKKLTKKLNGNSIEFSKMFQLLNCHGLMQFVRGQWEDDNC